MTSDKLTRTAMAEYGWHPKEWFGHLARQTATASGKPITFLVAVLTIVIWGVCGPLFHYSDTWQLVINTGTTIITFLMVFLIQNTQNRDTMAVQLKLGELILAMRGAEDRMAVAEEMSDEELQTLHDDCRRRADIAMESLSARRAHLAAEADDASGGGSAKRTGKRNGAAVEKPAGKSAAE